MNFVQESRLPGPIYWETPPKCSYWYKKGVRRNGARISQWNIPAGNRTNFSDMPLLPEIFLLNYPKNRVILLSNRNFRKLFSLVNVFSARVLCVTCFQVPFTEKRLQNAHAGIKNVWGEMGQEFPSETFLPENRTNFSDIPLLREIFLLNNPKNCVIFTFFLNVFSTRVLYRTWLATTDLWKNLWWSSSRDNFFLLLIFSTM